MIAPRYAHVTSPSTTGRLRRWFRHLNRAMIVLWRLGLGPVMSVWPAGFGRVFVIEHIGRRSGTTYQTPLNYTIVRRDLFCVAGFGPGTDWYRNIMTNPTVTVWLPSGRWSATAEDVSDRPERLDLVRRVLIDSGFAAPLVGLYPRRMSDVELGAATSGYRVLRLRLQQRTAPPNADLVWIWWLAAIAVAALAYRRNTLRR